jgi:hypothetical protein
MGGLTHRMETNDVPVWRRPRLRLTHPLRAHMRRENGMSIGQARVGHLP